MAAPLDQDGLDAALAGAGYFADDGLVTALYLALELGKPLLLEGMPGVGKTEVGNVLARILGRDCIRLQCYEGIDASRALYDWDHVRQLAHVEQGLSRIEGVLGTGVAWNDAAVERCLA